MHIIYVHAYTYYSTGNVCIYMPILYVCTYTCYSTGNVCIHVHIYIYFNTGNALAKLVL